ncbi:hypothetical protein HPB49_011113 [Dermacentor silvarum]|uniref:Uncharacterized protein n=1 Tax=Dermacentor silvarum TaxID=543639 RepID=A0ACB8CR25_DERSI|nr:hypothetical protein HPB49_011113 [Dermacentor silvarum]
MAGTGGILVILLLLLGGSPTSTRSAEAETCNKRVNITFTTLPPADVIEGPEAVTNSGLLSLFLRLHRAFGGMYFTGDLPGAVTKSDNLDASLVTDLLLGSSGVLLLLVASIVMAVLVPCIGLVVVCVRYRQPPADAQPETENQAAARVKWSLCFWVLLSSLTVMVLGALVTKDHASMTLDGLQKQGRYLADSIPGVLHQPINDFGVIGGPNLREFLSALDHRIDGLLRMSRLIKMIEQAANSSAIKKVRESTGKGSNSVDDTIKPCIGSCGSVIEKKLKDIKLNLDDFFNSSQVQLPPIVQELKEKLTKDDLHRYFAQIPSKKKVGMDLRNQAKETKATLHKYADRFSESVGELNDTVKRSVEEIKKALVSLYNISDDVATGLRIYEAVITVVAGVITIIATLYVLEAYALNIASRQRQGGGASSKPRHLVATSGSHSGHRKRATVASSKRLHGEKHLASGRRFVRKTAGRFESPERRESRNAPQTARNRRRRRQGDGDIGGFKPPADLSSALQKKFTAKALKGVVERFSQCASAKVPLVKLLGKDLVTNLARVILGKSSPWLGLVDDTAGPPKFKALENLGSQWSVLNIGKDVKKQLNVFTQSWIDVKEFKKLLTAADKAVNDFTKLETAKDMAEKQLRVPGVRLQKPVRIDLASSDDATLPYLAELAKKIHEAALLSVSAIFTMPESSTVTHLETRIDDLAEAIASLHAS